MYVNLTQYQLDRLNYIRRNSRWRGTPLPAFISIVIDDWLSGGLYLTSDSSFPDQWEYIKSARCVKCLYFARRTQNMAVYGHT